jgi:hypothetical protein
MLRSALRMLWSRTAKKQYINSVRYKKGGRFHVQCVACDLEMWVGAKARPVNKDGSLSKRRPQKLFDVDHVDGITPLGDPIKGLGPYWESMMMGELQILCKPCHAIKTQADKKKSTNSTKGPCRNSR